MITQIATKATMPQAITQSMVSDMTSLFILRRRYRGQFRDAGPYRPLNRVRLICTERPVVGDLRGAVLCAEKLSPPCPVEQTPQLAVGRLGQRGFDALLAGRLGLPGDHGL